MPPHVFLAALCKGVSKGDDGYLNLHSIVHAVTILDEGPAGLDLQGVVRIISDDPGTYAFRARVVSPSGELASVEHAIEVELQVGLIRTIVIDFQVQPEEQGFFWFEVEVGQEPMTRVPLAVEWAPDSRGSR